MKTKKAPLCSNCKESNKIRGDEVVVALAEFHVSGKKDNGERWMPFQKNLCCCCLGVVMEDYDKEIKVDGVIFNGKTLDRFVMKELGLSRFFDAVDVDFEIHAKIAEALKDTNPDERKQAVIRTILEN